MPIKFLLIDDDGDDRDLFCEALEAISPGIICYCENNGQTALNKLDSKKIELPDVIFLDLNMPIMDGWSCLSTLKGSDEFKNIPVIIYSTSSYSDDIKKAGLAGALCFFTKPSDFKTLKKHLEIIIEHIITGSLSTLPARFPSVFLSAHH